MRGIRLKEPAIIALETMRSHKLRSFLMLLGVILSVSTLILVVALINGTNAYIADRVANMGNGVFLIARYGIINSREGFVKAARRNKQLTYDDFVALRDGLKLPKNVGLECRFTDTARHEATELRGCFGARRDRQHRRDGYRGGRARPLHQR